MTTDLRIKNNATLYIALKIAGAAVGLVNTILLARILGTTQYGVLALTLAAANLLATFSALGLPYWITREVAISRKHGHFRRLLSIARKGLQLCLVVSAIPALFATAAYCYTLVSPASAFTSTVPLTVIALAVAFIPIASINQVRAAIIRGLGRALTADFPDIIIRPLCILITICVAIALTVHGGAALGMTIQISGAAVALAVGCVLLWRSVTTVTRDRTGSSNADPQEEVHFRHLLRTAPQFLVILLLATMDGQLSIYLVGMFSGAANVGIFQVALQPLNVILMGLVAVGAYAQPRIAAAWAQNQKGGAQEVVTQATRFSSQLALAFGAALIIFASPIIRLYGSGYAEAALLLRILALGQIIHGVTGPIGIVMLMTGKQKQLFFFDTLFLVLKVILLSIGIIYFGLMGAAIAEVFCLLIMRIAGVLFVYKHTGILTTMWGRQRTHNS